METRRLAGWLAGGGWVWVWVWGYMRVYLTQTMRRRRRRLSRWVVCTATKMTTPMPFL